MSSVVSRLVTGRSAAASAFQQPPRLIKQAPVTVAFAWPSSSSPAPAGTSMALLRSCSRELQAPPPPPAGRRVLPAAKMAGSTADDDHAMNLQWHIDSAHRILLPIAHLMSEMKREATDSSKKTAVPGEPNTTHSKHLEFIKKLTEVFDKFVQFMGFNEIQPSIDVEKYWTVLQDYAFALVDANDTAMEILGAYEPNGPKEIHNVELSERLREKNKFNFKTEMEKYMLVVGTEDTDDVFLQLRTVIKVIKDKRKHASGKYI